MRCEDLTRELAAPSGACDPAAMAEHLARCPECASWAERDAELTRLWDATRPATPTPAAWDAAWAGIAQALDRPPLRLAGDTSPAPTPEHVPSRPGRRAMVLFGLVQVAAAAAVLVAAFLSSRPAPKSDHIAQSTHAPSPPAPVAVEFEQGELGVIRFDAGGKCETMDLALNESPIRIDSTYEAFNEWEGNATQ